MGSSYFDQQLGNGRFGSSRKGKKGGSEKQKQPQRGLGVAQLEKIRLQNEMMAGYLPSLHSPFQADLSKEDLRVQMGYPSSPSSSTATSSSTSHFGAQTNMMGFGGSSGTEFRLYGEHYSAGVTSRSLLQPTTLPLMEQNMQINRRHDRHHSMGSISQSSDLSSSSELDLELKLSL
ncbi:protein SPEAR1 isoform X2 [Canna indica]|uniref:Protein SPEAR1 isoform X2 n=1 Tax=Canna indica TaxID=4628 RepID=A0AAQ3KHU5_9LILI|nr:protein SPEAR1 isoform X2 [Canna indica]